MTYHFEPLEQGTYPQLQYPPYKSTMLRGPAQPALRVALPEAAAEPFALDKTLLKHNDADLTRQGKSAPLGEKIVVSGLVKDEDGKLLRNSLVEVWQCNSAGRYWHKKDQHDAPVDPNFFGLGKMLTDDAGRYRFITIKPGPYPWGNHDKAWRPAHIHFSLFGNAYAQRLVTQMYFPSDPLLPIDPIFNSVPDAAARSRLISQLNMDMTVGAEMLGYEFNIVLQGKGATPFGL
jgi:protocatechuate 3,4-dioxygenase, beta subunit